MLNKKISYIFLFVLINLHVFFPIKSNYFFMGEVLKTDVAISKVEISDNYIILIFKDKIVYLYDLDTQVSKKIKGLDSEIISISISPDNKFAAFGCVNNNVYIYDLERQEEVCWILSHDGPVSALEFSDCSKFIFSGSWDTNVILSDLEGKTVNKFIGSSCFVYSIAAFKNKPFAIIGSWDNYYYLWNYTTGTSLAVNAQDFIHYVDISLDSKFAIIGGMNFIRYLNLKDEKSILNFNSKDITSYTSLLGANNLFLYLDINGNLVLQDLDTRKSILIDNLHNKVGALKILPNRSLILVQDQFGIFAYNFNLITSLLLN